MSNRQKKKKKEWKTNEGMLHGGIEETTTTKKKSCRTQACKRVQRTPQWCTHTKKKKNIDSHFLECALFLSKTAPSVFLFSLIYEGPIDVRTNIHKKKKKRASQIRSLVSLSCIYDNRRKKKKKTLFAMRNPSISLCAWGAAYCPSFSSGSRRSVDSTTRESKAMPSSQQLWST